MTAISKPTAAEEIQHYVKKVFELECKMMEKEGTIRALEFEVDLQKLLYSQLEKFSTELIKMK